MTQEKFKKCPSCQNFIPEPATTCMYCGAAQAAMKPEKKKRGILGNILLWGVMGFFGCIVLFVIGSFLSDGESPTTSAPAGSVASRPTFTPTASGVEAALALATMVPTVEVPTPIPTPAPAIGQDVVVREVRWKLLEAMDVGQELKSDNQFIDSKQTTGKFIRIRFEIENRGTDMKSFGGVPLRDGQGREFSRYSDGFMFTPDSETCIIENLNPNITRFCTVIYEVAADATNLVFVATELNPFMSDEALISLGF